MKSPALSLFAPIREWFFLGEAERTIRGYTTAQHALVRAHYDAGLDRFRAANGIVEAVSASVLLREGIRHLLLSRAAAQDPRADGDSLAHIDLAAALPELPADPDRPDVSPGDTERARSALASSDPLYFDRLAPEAAEATRTALERALSSLRHQVEPRTVAYVRGSRRGRLAAAAVLGLYVVYRITAAMLLPPNIALNKPVHASSYRVNPPDGHELVDGDIGPTYGIHTANEDSPRVTIDLLGVHKLRTVKVHNRGDGWFDEGLPLVVEVSVDGQNYEPIGRREEHFDRDPPWVIDAGRHPARFVRLRGDRPGSYIALSEVEVFGEK
jgi:hypothetical protein